MELNEYQRQAKEVSKVRDDDTPYFWAIWGLGIAGEAGEVADHVKKVMRDDDCEITPERAEALGEELGDVMWYVGRLAGMIGMTLEEVALMNLNKLAALQKQMGDSRD